MFILKGKCKLCGKNCDLCSSHIVPKYIIKYLKDTSPTGYLRKLNLINKRCQDGFKSFLFCKSCENNLSVLEQKFSYIFKSFCKNNSLNLSYDDNLNKFAYSLSLRNIIYNKKDNSLYLKDVCNYWKKLLLSNKLDLIYSHNILFLDDKNLEIHFNRYILPNLLRMNFFSEFPEFIDYFKKLFYSYIKRSVDLDIINGNKEIFYIYNKLPSIIILSVLNFEDEKLNIKNKNLLINDHGEIKIREQEILDSLFWKFLQNKLCWLCMNSQLSRNQSKIIMKDLLNNTSKFKSSETFKIWGSFK